MSLAGIRSEIRQELNNPDTLLDVSRAGYRLATVSAFIAVAGAKDDIEARRPITTETKVGILGVAGGAVLSGIALYGYMRSVS